VPRGLRASNSGADPGHRSDEEERAGLSGTASSEAEAAEAPSGALEAPAGAGAPEPDDPAATSAVPPDDPAAGAANGAAADPANGAIIDAASSVTATAANGGAPTRADTAAVSTIDDSGPRSAEDDQGARATSTDVARPEDVPPEPTAGQPRGLRARFTRRSGRRRPGANRVPGMIFAAITIVPALLVMAWLLAGLPLLLANRFSDIPMLIISVPLAVALIFVACRELPAAWPHGIREFWDQRRDRPEPAASPDTVSTEVLGSPKQAPKEAPEEVPEEAARPGRPKPDVPWWSLISTLIVVAGFAVWQLAENSQQIIVLRDPGTYFQFAYWIAQQGTTHIPQNLAAFHGSHPGMTFSSLGFYQTGTTIQPQFMAGLPMVLAIGVWAGGPLTAVAMAPVIGACAILAFAGLVGRLAGGRWAPAAALVLAVTLPQQYTSRNTFSETLAQIVLFGGLSLLADSFTLTSGRHVLPAPAVTSWRDGPAPNVALAFFAGLAIGLTLLIRIDGASDLLPAIPFLGILLVTRRPQAVPFGLGLILGVAYGLADGFLLARSYLDSIAPSLRPLAIIVLAAIVVTGIGMAIVNVPASRRWIRYLLRSRPLRWLPEVAAVLTVLVIIGFAVRPYFQTVRGETVPATINYVAELQKLAGLPIDGHRQYAEDSLYWVIWYLGVPAVILGTLGLALLVRRGLKSLITWRDSGAARIWALPLLIAGWVIVSVLWRPGIIPDQPWASRRLVPMVIPGLILAAAWMAAWIKERGHQLGASRSAGSIVAVCCVIALLVPAAVTTFGVGTTKTAGGSTRLTANGLAFKRTAQGENRAVRQLCSAIGPDASVVIVDAQTADRFSQVVRGMCDTPTTRMDSPTNSEVSTVVTGIEHVGRRPVLLAGTQDQLASFGGSAREVVNLLTTQDAHELTQPPTRNWLIHFTVWMSDPAGVTGGAVTNQTAEYSRHA
jgi:hypothetical protein